jgi:threonine/homoserine/homoserine lactone efflux protein
MSAFLPILIAGVTGFISGLLLSIPIGPINLTILNEGARRGFKWAALIGLGATVMEIIYCFIAFTSFANFLTYRYVKCPMEVASFALMLYLGMKFLIARSPEPLRFGAATGRIEARLEQRFHPHSAFMTGLVRVMGNVGVLVSWGVFAANFMLRGWVTPDWPGKCACVAGVGLGTGLWFFCLSWLVSLGRGKFSKASLLRVEHLSGVILLLLALSYGWMIILDLRGD